MKTNAEGIRLIKSFESLRLKPYLCPAGIPSIGWGATRGLDGTRITTQSHPITRAEAETLFDRDIRSVESAVRRLIRVPLTSNQFSALVSFTYNLGSGRLQSSTLRARLNRGDYDVGNEFPKWRLAGGRISKGLVRRRTAERELFMMDNEAEYRSPEV